MYSGTANRNVWIPRLQNISDFCNTSFSSPQQARPYMYERQYNVRGALECCNDADLCNSGELDAYASRCTQNTDYSAFLSSSYQCLTNSQYAWLKQITCQRKLANFIGNCLRDGRIEDKSTCPRRSICIPEVRRLVRQYGYVFIQIYIQIM